MKYSKTVYTIGKDRIKEIIGIESIIIQPGETVLVKVKKGMDIDFMLGLSNPLRKALNIPDGSQVLVMEEGIQLEKVVMKGETITCPHCNSILQLVEDEPNSGEVITPDNVPSEKKWVKLEKERWEKINSTNWGQLR